MTSTSNNAIVGYTGFVGSNLLSFYHFDHFYNSKNFHKAKGQSFDTLFFCGVPAVKWLANKFPEDDDATMATLKSILGTIQVNKIILISTIDVYEYVDNSCLHEDYDCDWVHNHTYGRNRYLFELFVQQQFPNKCHIIRLPALFGKGLKKNVIYDLIHGNQVENISTKTKFQWYDLGWLKKDIDYIIDENISLANLFTEPLETIRILELFHYPIETFDKNQSALTYNLKTKHTSSGYIRTKEEVLHNIKCFLHNEQKDKSNLVVSNICIKHTSQKQFAHILRLYGITNVQIAPTTLIKDWSELEEMDLSVFNECGLKVYSMQSICYNIASNIFDDNTSYDLLNHMRKIISFAASKKIQVLVFGCPRNRKVNEMTSENETKFIEFFRKLGNFIGERNVTICIEPNSKEYGCNFINKIDEAALWVKKINHPKIRMMVDVGNAIMEKDTLEDILDCKEYIYNVDVANSQMLPFVQASEEHRKFIKLLKQIQYERKINLEMQIKDAPNAEKELAILTKSLQTFINIV